ncbi:MAG: cobalamin-dependent protein, partial [Negativicutes bacterium]
SNISYGLPNRPLINSTFFAMCLAAGLDAPIMNPYDEEMQRVLIASAALLGHDPNGRAYAKKMAAPEGETAAKAPAADLDPIEAIKSAVKDGAKEMMDELVTRAVKAGISANDITEKALTAAMNEIGEGFGAGTVFLPEVLLSAEAMKTAFDKLSELLPAAEKETRGTVILATVKGDVHDLGKNIVGALLSNSGFTVIDLGKDVPSADIIRAAKEHDADIVGLSALMTTTMIEIDQVVNELRAAKSRAHIIVGGAAVTEEYAREAGADYYAPDGVAAVRIARRITEKQTLS